MRESGGGGDPLRLRATPSRVRVAAHAAGLGDEATTRAVAIATTTPSPAEWRRFLSAACAFLGTMLLLAGAMVALVALFAIPQTNELVIGLFWFVLKVFVIVYMFIWYRGTFPRYRYDQLMNVGWKYLIPISMGSLVVNGVVLLLTR